MKTHNFKLVNADTDSISFCKQDGSEFSEEEQQELLAELNSNFPPTIEFEHDGLFNKLIVLKAKNYILYDGEKIKLKGSSLKSSTMEPKLKEFNNEIINAMVFDKGGYTEIYNKYIQEALNVTDIKPWASKKTISTKTMESERTNESKIRDAFEGTEYVEGDKVYVFYKEDESLCLVENFDGEYDRKKLLQKLFKCTKRFETVLDVKLLFPNYSLIKAYKKLIEEGLQIAS